MAALDDRNSAQLVERPACGHVAGVLSGPERAHHSGQTPEQDTWPIRLHPCDERGRDNAARPAVRFATSAFITSSWSIAAGTVGVFSGGESFHEPWPRTLQQALCRLGACRKTTQLTDSLVSRFP